MRTTELQMIVWREGKYYVAQCLNVDVSSFGKTRTEALKNLREALELYFEEAKVPALPRVEEPTVVTQPWRHA